MAGKSIKGSQLADSLTKTGPSATCLFDVRHLLGRRGPEAGRVPQVRTVTPRGRESARAERRRKAQTGT